MVGVEPQPLVEPGAQVNGPPLPLAFDLELDHDEGHILDLDTAGLERGHQPVAAIGGPPQGGGEESRHAGSSDLPSLVVPVPFGVDGHPEFSLTAFGQQ